MSNTQEAQDELREIAERVAAEDQRLIVRWVDEGRIMPAEVVGEREGFSVMRVTRATLTAKIDGEAVQRTIEGLGLDEIKRVLAGYPIDVLYRSDNITR